MSDLLFRVEYRPFGSDAAKLVNVTAKPSAGTDGKWYAVAPGAGCSKDFATARDAVHSLVDADLGLVLDIVSVEAAPAKPAPRKRAARVVQPAQLSFLLSIDTGNAAFDEADGYQGYEVARILRHVADQVDGARFTEALKVSLHDVNGNFCGEWQVVDTSKPVRAARPSRPYHVLLERDCDLSPWFVHFGDYDRECVQAELQDRRDAGVASRYLKVITCGSRKAEIDAAVAKLNAGR